MNHGALVRDTTGGNPALGVSGVRVSRIIELLGQGLHVSDVLAQHPALTRTDMLTALQITAAAADRG